MATGLQQQQEDRADDDEDDAFSHGSRPATSISDAIASMGGGRPSPLDRDDSSDTTGFFSFTSQQQRRAAGERTTGSLASSSGFWSSSAPGVSVSGVMARLEPMESVTS